MGCFLLEMNSNSKLKERIPITKSIKGDLAWISGGGGLGSNKYV